MLTHVNPHMGFVTAQGWGACGDSAVPRAHQGEGQPLLQAARQLRPAPSPQPLPSASEQSGATGDLCGLASLRRQGLRQQAHVYACPVCKQVTDKSSYNDLHESLPLCLLFFSFPSFSFPLLSPSLSSSLDRGRSIPAGVRGSPSRSATSSRPQNSWRWAGGSGRQHTLLMEIQLTKVFIQYLCMLS